MDHPKCMVLISSLYGIKTMTITDPYGNVRPPVADIAQIPMVVHSLSEAFSDFISDDFWTPSKILVCSKTLMSKERRQYYNDVLGVNKHFGGNIRWAAVHLGSARFWPTFQLLLANAELVRVEERMFHHVIAYFMVYIPSIFDIYIITVHSLRASHQAKCEDYC